MYSGQEVVSQEECKIVLAEFYEGVSCYDPKGKKLHMVLKDWADATYAGKTLTTRAFSISPVNITLPLSKFVEAGIDKSTTGLEVIMHTEEYEKIRIMPLMYLPICSNYKFDTGSVKDACITPTKTKFTIVGEIAEVTSTLITLVNGTEISLLDIDDNVINHNATFENTIMDIVSYEYVDEQLVEVYTPTEVILVEAALSVSIKINDYSYKLYSCQYGPIGDFTYCNTLEETRLTALTDEYKEIGDGWFEIGATQFRLLPAMNFLRLEGLVFYFDLASEIEVREPIEATYTIYPCNPGPSPSPDYGYVNDACITPTNTTFTIAGKISSTTATTITLLGGTVISLLDINDIAINHSATFEYSTKNIINYEYIDGEFIEISTLTTVILVKAALAVSIKINDYSYTLYNCQYEPITDFTYCYLETEVMITSRANSHRPMENGWYEIGTTQFRLLPTMNSPRIEDDIFYFNLASEVEIRTPVVGIYPIYSCGPCPPDTFRLIPLEYFDDNYKLHLEWTIEGTYTIEDNCVINKNDRYCFYTDKLSLPAEQGLIPNDCHTYYRKNGGARIETPLRSAPVPPDQRLVWSQEKCKFVLRCENLGSYPCYVCIDCENQADGETIRLSSKDMPTNKVCTSIGEKDIRDYVYGSQAGIVHPLGTYPDIPLNFDYPVASPTMANFIYIRGTSMFLKMTNNLDFTYFTFIGNLARGIETPDVKDNSSDIESIQSVLFLPFLYLTVFKLPFEYVRSDGLDQSIWYNMDPDLPEISPAQGFDFRIKTSDLAGLIDSAWTTGFNWSEGCHWISASIFNSVPATDILIGPDNIEDIDSIVCEPNKRVKFNYSNIPLLNGIGAPPNTYGVYQEAFNKYAEDIKFLASKEAEAFAYQTLAYKQELKPRYPQV